jgi:hypothetical protein
VQSIRLAGLFEWSVRQKFETLANHSLSDRRMSEKMMALNFARKDNELLIKKQPQLAKLIRKVLQVRPKSRVIRSGCKKEC